MSADIYQWPEAVLIDETTEEYEYFEYSPDSETIESLNGVREIKFNVEALSTFVHPHESFLYFEGQILTVQNNDNFRDLENVTLANDGILHLFSELKYTINGQPIEDILNPAISSIMLGILRYPDDFSETEGLMQCWYKDEGDGGVIGTVIDSFQTQVNNVDVWHDTIKSFNNIGREKRKKLFYDSISVPANKGKFSFCIPLKHIFGFCDDYDKVMYGVNHGLSLFRKGDDTAIHRSARFVHHGVPADVGAAKVVLKKIKWCVPHVKPSLAIFNELTEKIGKGENVKIGFKSRKVDEKIVDSATWSWRVAVTSGNETPRFLILGFQIGNKTQQNGEDNTKAGNPSVFDNCEVEHIQVKMLGRLYPSQVEVLDFPNNQYSKAYNNAAKFRELFDGTPDLFSHLGINPIDFKNLYPLFVFNVSNQIPKTISAVVEVVFNVKFKSNPAVNRAGGPVLTTAYCLTISDKIFDLKGDGSKMRTYIT